MSAEYNDFSMNIQSQAETEGSNLLLPYIAPVSQGYGSINSTYIENPMTDNDPSLSFVDVFKRISGIAIPMSLSFAFSFEVFLAVLLLQILSESDEDTAAASLVSTMMNTVCALALAPLVIISNDLSKKIGRWKKEEKRLENEENSTEMELYDISCEKEKIESVTVNSFLLGSATTVPAMLIFYYSSSILTSVFHQNSDVTQSAQKFLRPFAFGLPGLMLKVNLEQIIFSFGKAKPAMWMGLSGLSVGTALSMLLGFGVKIGPIQFPRMKQTGVALGFVLESYLTGLAYGLFVKFGKECRQFDFYSISTEKIRRNWDELKMMLSNGGINTFTMSIELALTLSVVIFSGLLGTKQQAAMASCMQFIYFEFIFLAAFSFTCAQELSRKLGAEKWDDAQKIAMYGILTSLVYISPLPLLFAVYPKALEALSGGVSDDAASILRSLVPIMSLGVILDCVRFNLLQQCRSLNDLLVPSIIALLGLSSGIGLAAILGFETPMGIDGIGAGYTLGIGITAGALFLRWRPKIQQLTVVEADTNTALEPEAPASGGLWNCFASFFSSSRKSDDLGRDPNLMEELGSCAK